MTEASTDRSHAPITTKTLAAMLLTVGQVCGRYPGKSGRRIAPSTVTRWIIDGCPARDGTRVRLVATRCGSRWLIAPADLDTFFAALAATPTSTPAAAATAKPIATRSDINRAAAAAEALARRGA